MTEQQNQNKSRSNVLKIIFRSLPVLGILALVIGLVWAVWRAQFDTTAYSLCGAGLVLFLTLFLKAEAANLKYYLHVFVYSILVFGICIVGYLFVSQYDDQIDLTEKKFFSLSEYTTSYLNNLDEDVEITIFDTSSEPYQEMFDRYKRASKHVEWRVVNPKKNPEKARAMGEVIEFYDIILKSGDRSTKISARDLGQNWENTLTNAILEVSYDRSVKVYLTRGHGEIDMEAPEEPASRGAPVTQSQPSLSVFIEQLANRGTTTEALNLAMTGGVPDDASLVAIVGPKGDLKPKEVEWLRDYMNRDGHLLVMLDINPRLEPMPMPNMDALLEDYGIRVPDKLVVDALSSRVGSSPYLPLLSWVNEEHALTRKLRATSTNLPEMRPIEKTQKPSGMEVTDLLRSSPLSWGASYADVRVSIQSKKSPKPPAGAKPAAQVLAVAVTKTPPPQIPNMPPPLDEAGARLVVFGSSSLIWNDNFASLSLVRDLMSHTVNWLTNQEDMIEVPPRTLAGTPIILKDAQLRLIFVLAVLVIPAAMFFGGVSYSLLRRRR